jgi:hypothetical protein
MKFQVAASTTIYKGGIVMLDADGFAIPGADTASLNVVGIAAEGRDNSSGSDGDLEVEVECDAEFLFAATSITDAMHGTVMVVVDDNTIDDIAGATNDRPVGILTQRVSNTQGWVYVPGVTGRLS